MVMSFSIVENVDQPAKEKAIAPSTNPSTPRLTGPDTHLLYSIVEYLTDGVLIVDRAGAWIYANAIAHQICQQLRVEHDLGQTVQNTIPSAVWQVCQLLLNSPGSGNNCPSVLESEIVLKSTNHYRVRVQWLHLEDAHHPYLLITLEDCYQALRNRAIVEAQRYGLTSRQAEVWLLYRTGVSYRDIAATLFVTLNTVKRHMKDIYAKQKSMKD
jgi:DNA-binding CsgD family transcriptional regulator